MNTEEQTIQTEAACAVPTEQPSDSTAEAYDEDTEVTEVSAEGAETPTAEEEALPMPTEVTDLLSTEYAALVAAFPGEIPYAHLAEMPQLGIFLSLRQKGLSPRQAYLAAEGTRVPPVQSGSTTHLRAAAPRTVAPTAPILLSRETMDEWRRLFPHLSDREINDLYRRTAPTQIY